MIRLLKKLTLFAFIIVLLISVLLFYLYKIGGNDLPAPAYSNSISFNEKIDFLKDKDPANIKIAAIGSSMTLNNVDSRTIVNNLGENYINLGSWGFKISDTEEYLKNMIELLPELKTVIISTTFVDFSSTTRNIEVDYDLVKKTLTYDLNLIAYALSFDLKYLFNHSKTNADKMKEKGSYDILKFDNFGGVILDIEQKDIIPERWNNRITKFDVSETELDHLKELILFLKTKNVRTVIAIPPQREGLTDKGELVIIREGTDKIEAVARSAGAVYVNSFDHGVWSDSLFVDYCHLNKEGAEMFTELITESVTNYLKMEKP